MNNQSLRLPEQNSVTLVGRLTHDPEVRFTTKGKAVCQFSLAVNRRYKDLSSGEWKDDTSFISVVVWGDSANRCGDRLKKGFPVHVDGRLRSRQWETKEGQKRNTIEVIARRVQFLSKVQSQPDVSQNEPVQPSGAGSVSDEEEIPF